MLRQQTSPLTVLLLFILLYLFSGCSPQNPQADVIRRSQFIMGTLVEITVRGGDKEKINPVIDLVFQEMKRIENLMSTHIPESDLSKVNRSAGGDFVSVSPEVMEVIRIAKRWGDISKGALDITIGPLVALWNFDEEKKIVPERSVLEQAVERVDYRNIEIQSGTIRLTQPGMSLHLGAIGKGYAVDRAIAVLLGHKIQNAIVNAGGDLMAIGTRDGDEPWVIGLQNPSRPQELMATFGVRDHAVATSGDYQKYFILDDIRYHHILNPLSGMPARGVKSVTVTAPTVTEADALATAAFVLGADKGMSLIESLEHMEGMMILEDGAQRFSKRFREQPRFSLK